MCLSREPREPGVLKVKMGQSVCRDRKELTVTKAGKAPRDKRVQWDLPGLRDHLVPMELM